jgi:capsular polysaccharide biosynthesis protein
MKQTKNYSTGKERREITQIDVIEKHLENKYGNLFKSVYLELTPFEEQVKYFNNAKLIIAAHGAGLSNLFFCKQRTKVIEVTCGKKWEFFDTISRVLNLQHIKCNKNKFDEIYNCIQMNTLKNKCTIIYRDMTMCLICL